MINLLPPDYKLMIKNARTNLHLVRYMVYFALVVIIAAGVVAYGMRLVESSAPDIEEQIVQKEAEAEKLAVAHEQAKTLKADLDLANRIIDRQVNISSLLDELADVLPSGVVLTNLTLSEDKTGPIKLDVDAKTTESVSVALQNINESDLFKGAEILLVQARDNNDSEYQFVGAINAYFDENFVLEEATDE